MSPRGLWIGHQEGANATPFLPRHVLGKALHAMGFQCLLMGVSHWINFIWSVSLDKKLPASCQIGLSQCNMSMSPLGRKWVFRSSGTAYSNMSTFYRTSLYDIWLKLCHYVTVKNMPFQILVHIRPLLFAVHHMETSPCTNTSQQTNVRFVARLMECQHATTRTFHPVECGGMEQRPSSELSWRQL